MLSRDIEDKDAAARQPLGAEGSLDSVEWLG